MRVLHVFKDYPPVPGGIEHIIRDLARAQAARGLQDGVLVTDPGPVAGRRPPRRDRDRGVGIVRVRRLATVASTPLSAELAVVLRRLRPDLVHVHIPYPVGEVAAWLHRHHTPYVATYHCDVVRRRRLLALYRPLLLRVLADAAVVMPTSRTYADSSPILRAARARQQVVPLGIDPTAFAPTVRARSTPGDPPTVLFVGVHRHYKGGEVLLHAAARLDGVRLVVAGDGPERPTWQRLAADLGIGDRVSFPGRVDEATLRALYGAADAFVLPSTSRAEAFGVTLLEAMASGLPAVATEVGSATSEVVIDGVTGAVVTAGDPDALAAGIRRVLDPGCWAGMRTASLDRAGSYTIGAMADRVQAAYGTVLRGPA
ncbi:MAG TPA: glycosyltransferase [Euzebya sp.]|nr:glycosyltransferase [Euzebya sp.]